MILFHHKECGRRSSNSRIIGGSEVDSHSIPWQVGINRGGNGYACGGTLLSSKHVLSAAHCTCKKDTWPNRPVKCTEWLEPSEINVVVAEHYQYEDSDGTGHEISKYNNHPNYDYNTDDYDFSMLHLTEPVNLGDQAIQACLPDLRFSGDKLVGKLLTVSGWGRIDAWGYPDELHSVDVPVMSQDDCKRAYGSGRITDAMICAGYENGGKDACQADSGGKWTIVFFNFRES